MDQQSSHHLKENDEFFDCSSSMSHWLEVDRVRVPDNVTHESSVSQDYSAYRWSKQAGLLKTVVIITLLSCFMNFTSCKIIEHCSLRDNASYVTHLNASGMLNGIFKSSIDSTSLGLPRLWTEPFEAFGTDSYPTFFTDELNIWKWHRDKYSGLHCLQKPTNYEASSPQSISTALVPYDGRGEGKCTFDSRSKDTQLIALPSEPMESCNSDTSDTSLLVEFIVMIENLFDAIHPHSHSVSDGLNYDQCSLSKYQELRLCGPEDFEYAVLTNACPVKSVNGTNTLFVYRYLYHSYGLDSMKFDANYYCLSFSINRQNGVNLYIRSPLFYAIVITSIIILYRCFTSPENHVCECTECAISDLEYRNNICTLRRGTQEHHNASLHNIREIELNQGNSKATLVEGEYEVELVHCRVT